MADTTPDDNNGLYLSNVLYAHQPCSVSEDEKVEEDKKSENSESQDKNTQSVKDEKSETEDINEKCKDDCKELGNAYMETYFQKITTYKYLWYKIMWALIYAPLFIFMVIFLAQLFQDYWSYPTTISIEIVRSGRNDFPGVTFCNENPLRKSMLSRLKHYQDLILLDDYLEASVDAFFKVRDEENDCDQNAFFKCSRTDDCIPKEWVCNGNMNCEDGSDESLNCSEFQGQTNQNDSEHQGICKWPFIQCLNEFYCAQPCDGIPECTARPAYDESSFFECRNVSKCGGTFQASSHDLKNITSPNYPGFYNPRQDCNYSIEADTNSSIIQLSLNDLAIEQGSDPNSCNDFLEIYDTNNQYISFVEGKHQLCGFTVPNKVLNSTGNRVTIRFKSDSLHVAQGFSISYRALPQSRKRRDASQHYRQPKVVPLNRRVLRSADTSCILTGQEGCQTSEIPKTDFIKAYKHASLAHIGVRELLFFPEVVFENFGYELDDFLVDCTFDGELCDRSQFAKYQHFDYGNCYSFNSLRHRNYSSPEFIQSYKTGRDSGLQLTFFVDSSDYIGVLAPYTGLRLLVHENLKYPNIRQMSLSVRPGESTEIALEKTSKYRKGGKFSNCTNSWPPQLMMNEGITSLWPVYDRGNCLYICYIKELARNCGCVTDYFEDIYTDAQLNEATWRKCDPSNETVDACMKKMFRTFFGDNGNCPCPQSCETVDYTETRATSVWPSESHMQMFEANLLRSKSTPAVNFVSELLGRRNVTKGEIKEAIRENFAHLQIFYTTMEFDRIVEDPKYNFSEMLGLIGGIAGLCLDWDTITILSFFEIILMWTYHKYRPNPTHK